MKRIALGHNKYAIVDDEDYEMLSKLSWHVHDAYATHSEYRYPKPPKTVYMQKLIMHPPKGKYVDHINGDGLDNRKSNLRIVTLSQNAINKKSPSGTKSGYRGVTYDPRSDVWQARISVNGKRISLGIRKTAKDAATLYIKAAKNMHGEYIHASVRELEKAILQ